MLTKYLSIPILLILFGCASKHTTISKWEDRALRNNKRWVLFHKKYKHWDCQTLVTEKTGVDNKLNMTTTSSFSRPVKSNIYDSRGNVVGSTTSYETSIITSDVYSGRERDDLLDNKYSIDHALSVCHENKPASKPRINNTNNIQIINRN